MRFPWRNSVSRSLILVFSFKVSLARPALTLFWSDDSLSTFSFIIDSIFGIREAVYLSKTFSMRMFALALGLHVYIFHHREGRLMSELGLVSSLGTSENCPAAVDVRAFRGGNCMCNIATHRHRLRCKRDFLYSVQATSLKC